MTAKDLLKQELGMKSDETVVSSFSKALEIRNKAKHRGVGAKIITHRGATGVAHKVVFK